MTTQRLDQRNESTAKPEKVSCAAPDPLRLLEEEHALQRELCDLLEQLADSLPFEIDRSQAEVAKAILDGSFTRHTQFEEQALFPLIRQRVPPGDDLHAMLARLEDEHQHDESEVMEIGEALSSIASGKPPENADMLGYQLRGFFESQRRHISWEDSVVIPAARRVLTPEDLASLQDWIMKSDHPRCCRHSLLEIRRVRSGQALCQTCTSVRIDH
jgi:hemerythrin-like domain-containing protein